MFLDVVILIIQEISRILRIVSVRVGLATSARRSVAGLDVVQVVVVRRRRIQVVLDSFGHDTGGKVDLLLLVERVSAEIVLVA